jgi:hypothetical protein
MALGDPLDSWPASTVSFADADYVHASAPRHRLQGGRSTSNLATTRAGAVMSPASTLARISGAGRRRRETRLSTWQMVAEDSTGWARSLRPIMEAGFPFVGLRYSPQLTTTSW